MLEKKHFIVCLLVVGIIGIAFFGINLMVCPSAKEMAYMKKNAEKVVTAYPEARLTIKEGLFGLYIVSSNKEILFSPWTGCPAAHPNDSDDAPLCATFSQKYPKGEGSRNPKSGFDPGRVRNEAFLKLLYGENEKEVEESLVEIDMLGEPWKFTTRQGVASAMLRIKEKLQQAMQANPTLKDYILPAGGSYMWRPISGSNRLSVHSFGASHDLNTDKGIYWLWHPTPKKIEAARLHYPQLLVDIFEVEGFIWGGKWHSFDFMHFEYRPELLLSD